jgi:hypothetical protein
LMTFKGGGALWHKPFDGFFRVFVDYAFPWSPDVRNISD